MIDIRDVAEAFGLDEPVGSLVSIRERGQVMAWRVETGSGPVLIKRFWADQELPWRDQLEPAMELERLAVEAGIDTPRPLMPVKPYFGSVAQIEHLGLVRAFPYVEHQPLSDGDDVAAWLGTTLARVHRLRTLDEVPAPNWWYAQFPPVPPEQWREWLAAGESHDSVWAPALRLHLEVVIELSVDVVETFVATGPHVLSHRDVEPWNVLMAGRRPILIDWDTAGPESAPLEAAYAFTVFAGRGRGEPDPEQIRRAHAAYVAAGGEPLVHRSGMLDRMVGYQLSKIATALGEFFDVSEADNRTRERLERLPRTVTRIRRWEQHFARL